MPKNFPKLIFSIGLCLGVGVVGSFFTLPSIPTWYVSLNKPSFNPPNWIFGPVWTILFLMMGVSAYLVWEKGINKKTKPALLVFIIQLFLNFFWSYSFFYLHLPVLAYIDIVFLWIAIFLTIQKFRKISNTAGLLLLPYLFWVSFASLLNLAIIVLN